MRRILTAAAALIGLLGLAPLAQADWQPTRPIKMICPFPAGGGTDQIARIVALQLSKRLGQQVVVENRGGANGGLGAQEVMRADPDGYTIGAISDLPMTVNPWMYEKLAYKPLQDFIPVARINHFPSLVVANPATGIKTDRRPDQGGQGEARHAELFVRRRRQLQPSRPGRAVGFKTGDQHRPRALSRRRPGDHGRPRRRRAAHVQQFRHRASPCRGGQAHRPGRRRQRTPARPIRISRPSPRPFRAST